jgi:hypothetical protein
MTTPTHAPFHTTRAPRHMVASADGLATQAGLAILAQVATPSTPPSPPTRPSRSPARTCAAWAATCSPWCITRVECSASTPAAAPAAAPSAAAVRADGHEVMPFRHDIRTVTIPGCVDGWVALHERFGSLPDGHPAGAGDLARPDGFPASPLLVGSLARLDARPARTAARAGRPGPPAQRSRAPPRRRRGAARRSRRRAGRVLQGAFGAACCDWATVGTPRPISRAARPSGWPRCKRRPGASTCSPCRPTRRATSRSAPRRWRATWTCPPTPPTNTGHTCSSRPRRWPGSTGPTCCTPAPMATSCCEPSPHVPPRRPAASQRTGRCRPRPATPRTCAPPIPRAWACR